MTDGEEDVLKCEEEKERKRRREEGKRKSEKGEVGSGRQSRIKKKKKSRADLAGDERRGCRSEMGRQIGC